MEKPVSNQVTLPVDRFELALALVYVFYKKGEINEATYQKIMKKYKRG